MSVVIGTVSAAKMLDAIRGGIDAGSIDSWQYDERGCFTPRARRLSRRAWLCPSILGSGQLKLEVVNGASAAALTAALLGAYQARFIEMLLVHFADDVSWASVIP